MSDTSKKESTSSSSSDTSNDYVHTAQGDAIGFWLRQDAERERAQKFEDYEPYDRGDGTIIGSRT